MVECNICGNVSHGGLKYDYQYHGVLNLCSRHSLDVSDFEHDLALINSDRITQERFDKRDLIRAYLLFMKHGLELSVNSFTSCSCSTVVISFPAP